MKGRVGSTHVLRTVLTTFVLAAALITAAIGVAVRTGQLALRPVLSGSMRPTFAPGDLLATWRVPVASLKTGDVIAFVPPGKNFEEMHRVVRITHRRGKVMIATRGDANGVSDPWGQISLRGSSVYRLKAIIPKLGWITTIPRGTLMMILLVPAGLLLIVSSAKAFTGTGSVGRRPTVNP